MKVENQLPKAYMQKTKCCLHVYGEDSYTFLQSQFSNDLPKGEAAFTCYGLWLNAKGRVLADSTIVRSGNDSYYIFSENSEASFIKETLENHIIADEVTIESIQLAGSILVNQSVAEFLAHRLGLQNEEGGLVGSNFIHSDLNSGVIFRTECLGEAGYVFYFSDTGNYALCKEALKERSLHWMSENELHLKRLALGMPLIPNEIGPNDLAGEGGLVPSAVSLTKGCYLGQEVVARLFHTGKAQRELFVMTFEKLVDSDTIQLPLEIRIHDRLLGELRTLYRSENDTNKWYGVAILKVRYLELIGSEFKLASASVDSLCKFSEFSEKITS